MTRPQAFLPQQRVQAPNSFAHRKQCGRTRLLFPHFWGARGRHVKQCDDCRAKGKLRERPPSQPKPVQRPKRLGRSPIYGSVREWILGRLARHLLPLMPDSVISIPPQYLVAGELDVEDEKRKLRDEGIIAAQSRGWYLVGKNARAMGERFWFSR